MDARSRRIILKRYPQGVPTAADFELTEAPLSEPQAGELLVETHWLSMDPAPRMRMTAGAHGALAPGGTVIGRGVGVVRESRHPSFSVGDWVAGELGWQEHAVLAPAGLRRVDPSLGAVQHALGVLGPSGIAAWCLVRLAAKVQAGDTVIVSAAAGSVGSVALQLVTIEGARAVGIIGGERQAQFVRDVLGVASLIDYRSTRLDADLERACPQGANVFLDSVGGSLHEAVMQRIADHARIVAFGYISRYNESSGAAPEYGRIYQLIRRRATLSGFLIADYAEYFDRALSELSGLVASGRLKYVESVSLGLDSAPAAFARLFDPDPVGKQLVRVI